MKLAVFFSLLSSLTFAQGLINRRAPSFSLPDSSFTQFDILDYRGRWLLISFMMATEQNCPTCKDLTKKLDGLQAKHGAKLAILGIVQTPQDNQDTVKRFLAETRTRIPILFDYSFVGIAYFKATPTRPTMDMPHVFAVDPSGTIVQDWSQVLLSGATWTGDVDKLVARGTVPPAAAPKAEPAKGKAPSKATK